jgi:sugar phosphate isomerase/epimerase
MRLFHASVEGAQHGAKGLDGFLEFAWRAGAAGCQPSNFMLEDGKGGFLPADTIRQKFAEAGKGFPQAWIGQDVGLKMDGFSIHCPTWVLLTAWTASKTMRPFLPANYVNETPARIEAWAENYILRFLDLCDELDVRILPMFWGVAFGWEVATGYPWGFWKGADYDLVQEGIERFVTKTAKIRAAARDHAIVLAHEIHPGTAAMCAQDFLMLVNACQGDPCLGVNADPSHCWEGESWQDRFNIVGDRIDGCHRKNHVVLQGYPLRCMEPDWKERTMQFTALDRGDIDLVRYTEQMLRVGYPRNYLETMGSDTAPLVVEAEGAFEELDDISLRGIRWVHQNCCFNVAGGSFEDGMGA